MKPISQLRAIVFALLILAGAGARHALAQERVNAEPSIANQGDRVPSLPRFNLAAGAGSAAVLRFAIASQPLLDMRIDRSKTKV